VLVAQLLQMVRIQPLHTLVEHLLPKAAVKAVIILKIKQAFYLVDV
jgi:hypothetical protein